MAFLVSIILISSILVWSLFRARFKGVVGEKTISSILYFLDGSKYKVINNVVLTSNGKTSQIDHVVISDFGIFVIETKNYKGWIVGGENSEYWTQVLYKRKERLYNPIWQNLGHIRALRTCLCEYPGIEYKSIIVFPTKAEIKVKSRTDVIYSYQLLKTIKSYSYPNLTETEKENIVQKINAANSAKTYDKRQHIYSIKQRIQKRESMIRANQCPQCGGKLVMRNGKFGKFGKFLGCSSFPRCRFSRNVD